jgi:predicted component of type VI protein secretion system
VKLQLVLLDGSHKGHRLTVEIGLAIVGRAKGSAIRIPSERVSRRHCRIWVERYKVWLEDLGSENGTYVNEAAVVDRVELNPGDELKIAGIRFRLQFQPPKPPPGQGGAEPEYEQADELEADLVPMERNVPAGAFDLPFDEEDEEAAAAAESMNLPTQDPFDFKNILRELDDKSDE